MRKNLIAALLAIVLLFACATCEAASLSREEKYNALLGELENYLNNANTMPLETICEHLQELGSYKFSAELATYAGVLLDLQNKDFQYISVNITTLEALEDFCAYLEENENLGTIDMLRAYAEGYQAEVKNDHEAAIRFYEQSNSFMDSFRRLIALKPNLIEEYYQEALMWYQQDTETGYQKTIEILQTKVARISNQHDYRDSQYYLQSAQEQLTRLTATELKITTQPQDVMVALGETCNISIAAQGDELCYRWYYADKDDEEFKKSSTTAEYAMLMTSDRNGRRVYCTVTDKYGNEISSNTVTLFAAAALKITEQPDFVTVALGQVAEVSTAADGEDLRYSWFYADNGKTIFDRSSTTDSTYSLMMTAERDGRRVYCIVTDKYGQTAKTRTVTLRAADPARITTQPQSVTVSRGQTAKVSVAASGDGLRYRWYYADSGSRQFKKSSVSTASYSLKMSASNNRRQVYCIVTDKYGTELKSNTVTLYAEEPVKIVKQSGNMTVADGKTARVTVTASGTELSYCWYYVEKGSTAHLRSKDTDATYEMIMTPERNGRQVYCIITDKYGATAQTKPVTISAAEPLKITRQPTDATATKGDTIKVSVEAKGEGLRYRWYYADQNQRTFEKTSVTTPEYSMLMTEARHGRRVYCIITDQYGQTAQSNAVILYAADPLVVAKQPTDVTVSFGKTAEVTFSVTGKGVTYQWFYADGASTKFERASANTATYSLLMTTARDGRRIYCIATDKYGKQVTSNTVTLHGVEPLKITKQPTNLSTPEGHAAKVTVTATGTGLSYRWYYADGEDQFVKSSVTDSTYTLLMTPERNGRRVYCEITDKYGNKQTTNTIKLLAVPSKPLVMSLDANLKGGTVYLNWASISQATEYQVYRSKGRGKKLELIATVTTNNYADTHCLHGFWNEYVVKAVNEYGTPIGESTRKDGDVYVK